MWQAVFVLVAFAGCGRFGFAPAGGAGGDALREDGPAPDVATVAIPASGVFAIATSEMRRTLAASASPAGVFTFSTWYRSSDVGDILLGTGISATQHTLIGASSNVSPGLPVFQHQEGGTFHLTGPDQRPWPFVDTWVHLVVAVDVRAPTIDGRVRWWVNGEPQANYLGPYAELPQDQALYLGQPILHTFGNKHIGSFDWIGSLADTYLIWGHALDASAFVTTVAPGVVRSIAYTGPVTPESVHFTYEVPGANTFPGQPSWMATSVVPSTVDVPY